MRIAISKLVGIEILANLISKGCEVMIKLIKTKANLIKVEKMEYDAILGMDWLAAYHAPVDCFEKQVTFKEGTPKFMFEGIKGNYHMPIISAMRATRLWAGDVEDF